MTPFLEQNLWRLVEQGWAGCPSFHPTISVKALKRTQSTNPSQWPGLIISSFTTGLLMEGALLPLCPLCDASTRRKRLGITVAGVYRLEALPVSSIRVLKNTNH